MDIFSIEETQANLAQLLEKVARGESFIITRSGQPVAQVSPAPGAVITADDDPRPKRRIGFMKGEIKIPDDFDTMMQEEIEEMFYGNPGKFKNR